jgi:hypothetical protein
MLRFMQTVFPCFVPELIPSAVVPELAPPTPFGHELMACLESVKDGDAKEYAGDIGKTLEWDETGGKVLLTVRRFPSLAVCATVRAAPLWEKYMDDRISKGIRHKFYFDSCEDAYEFRVDNDIDLVCAMREIRFLNELRLSLRA